MLDIKIIAIGKIKEKYFGEAIEEYLKRLKPFARIKIEELPSESFRESTKDNTKKIEGERILKLLAKQSQGTIIVLDEHGKEFNSVGFADFIDKKQAPLVFVIGGSLGLSEEILNKADYVISLSKMTFAHEMARLFLCEQLYRAATIIAHKTYHY